MEWGARLAPTLDGVHAAVIAAPDAETAANVALAIARVQGEKRRVAIADLVGEVAPLQALVTGDDPHGISDSFLYGVSLNKIARPIDESGSIFLMPSGTEAVALEAVYANERWRRLAAGVRGRDAVSLARRDHRLGRLAVRLHGPAAFHPRPRVGAERSVTEQP